MMGLRFGQTEEFRSTSRFAAVHYWQFEQRELKLNKKALQFPYLFSFFSQIFEVGKLRHFDSKSPRSYSSKLNWKTEISLFVFFIGSGSAVIVESKVSRFIWGNSF